MTMEAAIAFLTPTKLLTPPDDLPADVIKALIKILTQRSNDPLPSEWGQIIPAEWRKYLPSNLIANALQTAGRTAAAGAYWAARKAALDVLVGGPCLIGAELFSRTGHNDAGIILREFVFANGEQSRTFEWNSNFSLGFGRSGTTTGSVKRGLKVWAKRDGGKDRIRGVITALGHSFAPLYLDVRMTYVGPQAVSVEVSPEANIIGSFEYDGRVVGDNLVEWKAVNYMSLKSYFYEHPIQQVASYVPRLDVSLIENNDWPSQYGTTQQVIKWRTTLDGEVVG